MQTPLQFDKHTQFDSLLDEFDDYKEEKEVELERIRREKNSLTAELEKLGEEKKVVVKENDDKAYLELKEECEKLKEKLSSVEKLNVKLKIKLKQLLKEQNKSTKPEGEEETTAPVLNQDEINDNSTELIGKLFINKLSP
jgi:hypothetical protein